MLKNLIPGILIGALVMAGIWGLVHLLYSDADATSTVSTFDPKTHVNKGVIDLICELKLDLDGQLALGITANEPNRIAMAQIDFEKSSGWYQGKIAISENRGGTLTVSGNKLKVSRPAMFQRFGVMINREEFVIDRSTGSFTQTISTQDGRSVILIRGTCAKVVKPAF